jgi:cysteine synthase A
MRHLAEVTGRRAGGSTGTNLWGAFTLVAEMLAEGRTGSVVTLLCDGGERYAHTYYSDEWVAAQGLDLAPHAATLQRFATNGEWRITG